MQTAVSLPIVQSVSEAVPLYLSVQPTLNGRTSTLFVTPSLSLNQRTNTLSLTANVNSLAVSSNVHQVLPQPVVPLAIRNSGSIQYDGITPYFDAQERGLIPSTQFYRNDIDFVGTQALTRQSLFGVGVRVSSQMTYAFELMFSLSKTAGVTSHTVGWGFGGDAITDKFYANFLGPSTVTGVGGMGAFLTTINNTFPVPSTAAITTAAIIITVQMKGTVSFKYNGLFVPQYILSAAPGGAYSTMAGSYFSIYPIGRAFANNSIGSWANG